MKRKLARSPIRQAFLLTLSGFAAGSGVAAPPVSVPFEHAANYTFVEVRVRDRGLWFVFDTAAQGTAVNSATARRIGLEPSTSTEVLGAGGTMRVPIAREVTMEIGSLRLENLDVALVSLEHFEEVAGRSIDGILGADLLRGNVVALDHDRGLLEVHSHPDSFPFDQWGPPCPTTGPPGHIQIEGEIELLDGARIAASLIIDTGAGRFLDLATPFVRMHGLRTRVGTTYSVATRGLTGVGQRKDMGRVRGFRFCGRYLPAPGTGSGSSLPVGLSRDTRGVLARGDFDGLLGNAILKRFNTAFDTGRDRIFLRPNRDFTAPIRSDASGLLIVRKPGGPIRVSEVAANSPAAKAGVQAGDIVRSIGGQDAAAMTLDAAREELQDTGEVKRLEVERDGRVRSVEVRLRAWGAD